MQSKAFILVCIYDSPIRAICNCLSRSLQNHAVAKWRPERKRRRSMPSKQLRGEKVTHQPPTHEMNSIQSNPTPSQARKLLQCITAPPKDPIQSIINLHPPETTIHEPYPVATSSKFPRKEIQEEDATYGQLSPCSCT